MWEAEIYGRAKLARCDMGRFEQAEQGRATTRKSIRLPFNSTNSTNSTNFWAGNRCKSHQKGSKNANHFVKVPYLMKVPRNAPMAAISSHGRPLSSSMMPQLIKKANKTKTSMAAANFIGHYSSEIDFVCKHPLRLFGFTNNCMRGLCGENLNYKACNVMVTGYDRNAWENWSIANRQSRPRRWLE